MKPAATALGASRVVGWSWLLPKRRLGTRIVALSLGLLLLVQVASFGVIGSAIERNARRAVDAELVIAERVLQRLVSQNAQKLVEVARLLTTDYGFRSAVQSGHAPTIDSVLENHGRRVGAAASALLDTDLRLRASTPGNAHALASVAMELGSRIGAREQAGLVARHGEQLLQFVLVPMKSPAPQGWLLMGFAIDRELADEMRALSAVHLVLLVRSDEARPWRRAITTLADTLAGELEAQAPVLIDAASRPASLRLGRAQYGANVVTLAGGNDIRAVLLRSVDDVIAPYRDLQITLGALTLLGLLAFGVGGVLTARRVTRPLRDLVAATERLGRGDYATPVQGVRRNDEVGELAHAFERMRERISRHQRQVHRLAYWDELTGLPNRAQFTALVDAAIARAQAAGAPLSVLMLDLDRFKNVNDVLGYRVGDRVLQNVAERLARDCLREGDVVARLSGDEFAVLLRDADAELALAVAARIEHAFERPLEVDEQTVDLSAGIGAACRAATTAAGDVPAPALIGQAEVAMVAAKRRRDGPLCYEPAHDQGSARTLSLLSELRRALEQGELRLYLQPKVELARGRIVGAEALLRWQHPQRGLLPPAEFIGFAEQTGFIRKLTLWAFEQALLAWRELQRAGIALRVSVNLSARDLLDAQLPARLDALLQQHQVPAEALCLELTESAIMDDPQRARATLERLSACGFRLSIDDFGTGYSSLAYLKHLPVDELKIDRSFVMAMEREPGDAKIVRSTVDLAHNLGLSVVAEGVENAAVMGLLRELACDEAQGYHLARPMPAAELLGWCTAWAARHVSTAGPVAIVLH